MTVEHETPDSGDRGAGRGTAARWRRRAVAGTKTAAALAAVSLCVAMTVTQHDDPDGTDATVTTDEPTASTGRRDLTMATTPPAAPPPTSVPPAEAAPASSTPSLAPTTMPPAEADETAAPPGDDGTPAAAPGPSACRNSYDPACGPFFYDWPEPNRPATVSITASPAAPAVGQVVSFTVTVDDDDGNPDHPCTIFDSGGSIGLGACADEIERRHGPWDPPAPSTRVETYSATYSMPGSHTVRYETTEAGACDGPCAPVTALLTLTVGP